MPMSHEELVELVLGKGEQGDLAPGIIGIMRRQADRIDRHERRLNALERSLDRFRWTVGGFTIAGSVLGGIIVALFTQAAT